MIQLRIERNDLPGRQAEILTINCDPDKAGKHLNQNRPVYAVPSEACAGLQSSEYKSEVLVFHQRYGISIAGPGAFLLQLAGRGGKIDPQNGPSGSGRTAKRSRSTQWQSLVQSSTSWKHH